MGHETRLETETKSRDFIT